MRSRRPKPIIPNTRSTSVNATARRSVKSLEIISYGTRGMGSSMNLTSARACVNRNLWPWTSASSSSRIRSLLGSGTRAMTGWRTMIGLFRRQELERIQIISMQKFHLYYPSPPKEGTDRPVLRVVINEGTVCPFKLLTPTSHSGQAAHSRRVEIHIFPRRWTYRPRVFDLSLSKSECHEVSLLTDKIYLIRTDSLKELRRRASYIRLSPFWHLD